MACCFLSLKEKLILTNTLESYIKRREQQEMSFLSSPYLSFPFFFSLFFSLLFLPSFLHSFVKDMKIQLLLREKATPYYKRVKLCHVQTIQRTIYRLTCKYILQMMKIRNNSESTFPHTKERNKDINL